MNDKTTEQAAPLDENHVIAERRAKLARIREKGIAFPNDFRPLHTADALQAEHGDKTKEALEAAPIPVTVAGRMLLKRVMGKASFATIKDGSGARIQLYISNDSVGADAHDDFKHWDLGDTIGAVGTLFKTRTGELTVNVSQLRLLTKSIRPLPEKFHGLTDTEQRYRQRYVDLIVNDEARETFIIRSKTVAAIREFMVNAGYLEVETPMMHPIPGGAAARPFATHHNTLDMQLFLRIAPELYLKRLVVGGLERVFEINRNFRNEGISTRHNPEFTMMEFYIAYRDYHHLMDFTEEMFRFTANRVLGKTTFDYQGQQIDFGKPFDHLSILDAIRKYAPELANENFHDRATLERLLRARRVEIPKTAGVGSLQLLLFEETAEAKLVQPTFIIDYPAETSPLARRNDKNPEITDRFELFIASRELANGFSELNDAEDQAARFLDQAKAKDAGDQEAMHYDADYIRALEYGLPPTAGEGIGIDRLVMLLSNSASIRDVILFPQLRPSDIAS